MGTAYNLRGISFHQHVNWGRQQLHHVPYGEGIAKAYQNHQGKSDHQAYSKGVDPLSQANHEGVRFGRSRRNSRSIPEILRGGLSDLERGERAEVLRVTED
jgi:hypothetical protein